MDTLKEKIEDYISKKGYTKELVYNNLGMTRQGFEYTLKNETLKVTDFAKLVKMLAIDVKVFFGNEQIIDINQVNEPLVEYGKKKMIQKEVSGSEVEFLRSQVDKLTSIIEVLSKQIDTKNINL